jgi:hypothetical protein
MPSAMLFAISGRAAAIKPIGIAHSSSVYMT